LARWAKRGFAIHFRLEVMATMLAMDLNYHFCDGGIGKEKACSQHTQPEGYDTPQKNAHGHTPAWA